MENFDLMEKELLSLTKASELDRGVLRQVKKQQLRNIVEKYQLPVDNNATKNGIITEILKAIGLDSRYTYDGDFWQGD